MERLGQAGTPVALIPGMNVQDARTLAAEKSGALTTFLHGVFGDAATAEKFARFALQRLEVDFDEIGEGAAALYLLGREVCCEYVSAATFARLPLAAGDDALPLTGVLPAAPEQLVVALPRAARLALRLAVVDGLKPADVAAVLGASAERVARLLERVIAIVPAAKLAGALEDVGALTAADPAPVSEAAVSPTIVPGARRTTRRTAVSADSGSVPRGVSLSPLVSGGHPANRGNSPYTRPFPTRQVTALKPAPAGKSPVVSACLVAFLLLAGGPLSGYLGKAKEGKIAAATAAVAAVQPVQPATTPGALGTVELPGGQLPVMPGQEVVAPVRGEAHVRIPHVEMWLSAGARAQVHADRVVLVDGVVRVQVDGAITYLGIAEPLELKLSGGTYLLRRGEKRGTGMCTLAGLAEVTGKTARGLRAEAGRSIAMGADGAEVRDTAERLDDGWGREAARVAKAVSDAAHFSALPDGAPTMTLAIATSGAGGRALFAATGAKVGSAAADRGAAGYRQAF